MGQLEERGSKKSDGIPTEGEREGHLSDREGFSDVEITPMEQNQRNGRRRWNCNPLLSSRVQEYLIEWKYLRGFAAA